MSSDQTNSDMPPRFMEGPQSIPHYFRTVVDGSLKNLKDDFGEEASGKQGNKDGFHEQGNTFPFQNDCKSKHADTVKDLETAADRAIREEYNYITKTLNAELPNLEQKVDREMTHNSIRERVQKMEKCIEKRRKLNAFLDQRDMGDMDGCIEKGDSTWYFWLPLAIVVLLEFILNYWFLGEISVREKLTVASIAVFFVLIAGFSVSWLSKERRSVIVRNNEFHAFQKHGWTVAIISVLVLSFFALSSFIYYRAVIAFPVNPLEMVARLPNAVFRNGVADFALAVLNIAGLLVAIRTFVKAGWPVHGYERVAGLADEAEGELREYENYLDGLATKVFEEATEKVEKRQASCRNIQQHEIAIRGVCRKLPDVIEQEWNRIDGSYRTSIGLYRDHFGKQRNPCETEEINKVPDGFREGDPIDDLPERPHVGDNEMLGLIENFGDRARGFEGTTEQWMRENASPNELIEYARNRKLTLTQQTIRQAKKDGNDMRMLG